jgi:HK97 family phage major capsid protein
MGSEQVRRELAEARTNRERLFGELENLRARAEVDGASEGLQERIGNVNRAVARADDRIGELEAEFGRWAQLDAAIAAGQYDTGLADELARQHSPGRGGDPARDAALRAVDRNADFCWEGSAERVEQLVRRDTPNNLTSRYVAAVADEHYRSAWLKLMADPVGGHNRFTREEIAAVQAVTLVEAERALSIGTGSAGGFAVPYTLDPSIVASGNGVSNPLRGISRVETITTNEWRGVSSDGVTATYVAEATVAVDGSPVLAQPVLRAAQWRVFVPYSIELGQDWGTLQDELVRMTLDARDVLDSSMFYTGNGTAQPRGIMTDLSASQRVATAGTAAFAVGDPWLLKQGIPARFANTTTFAAHPKTFDTAYRFVGTNSSEPLQFDAGRGGGFLGRPKVEWSAVGTTMSTSGTIMLAGDFSNYLIADRLGVTAEPIQHLFSASTAGGMTFPTGQRGLYVYGRTAAGVLAANAFRALVVA